MNLSKHFIFSRLGIQNKNGDYINDWGFNGDYINDWAINGDYINNDWAINGE